MPLKPGKFSSLRPKVDETRIVENEAMNQWNCEEQGCAASAIGCGGAIGLRAIGWQFELGRKAEGFPHPPMIRFPKHRIDGKNGEVSARVFPNGIQAVDNLANACPIRG